MIATQIFISMIILISPIHDEKIKRVTDQSNLGQTSAPAKIRSIVSKSISFLLWPAKKIWKVINVLIPLRQNISTRKQGMGK
ncbi:uncharacterized protein LOC112601835 [Melanaphis sacchari]|uniref:uncharacterized protein LOC112601835 n=1 Tax=Melanaphis sacchari TaxID=742174 RepID=UPI000DC1343D|nr:uncharacterized protein LOC112601835 [Melanaphis sacchari]